MPRRFPLIASALAAALLAAGCLSLGPDFTPPAWEGPAVWSVGAADAVSPLPGGAPWWSVFGDPALDSLEEALLAQSPSLAATVARLDAAAARLGIARADRFPVATVSASAVRERQADDSGEGSSGSKQTRSTSLQLQWEIDFWGRVRRGVEAASAEWSAAGQDARAARLLLSAQLASAYVSLRTLQAQLACARTNETLQARTLDYVRSRRKSGLAGELDECRAAANLAATRAAVLAEALYRNGLTDFLNVLDAQRELAERRDALAAGLGDASAALIDVWKAFGGPCGEAPASAHEGGEP